jgi:hypothetical protein
MHSEDDNLLWEAGLRRKLSTEEQARLQAAMRDAVAADAAEDLALNAALRELPQVPVSSNFTHRVMEAIAQAPTPCQPEPSFGSRFWRGQWLPKPVWAVLLIGAVVFAGQQYRTHNLEVTAQSVAKISHAASVMTVDVLKDFEAINRFSRVTTPVDEELFAALN